VGAIPVAVKAWGEARLAPENVYRVIGEHLADVLRDEQFAGLYERTGRHAVSPAGLALVTLFQHLEQIPDREAAALVVSRLDWKYALHLPLEDAGFDFSDLCHFRQRLLTHGAARLVFEAVLTRIQRLGFLKKRGKQRTDALAVLGAVRALSELELVSETLRLAVRALEAADPVWLEQTVPASFREQYAHTRSDYQVSAPERARQFLQVGADGFWLLDRVGQAAGLRDLAAVRLLEEVWAQRYTRAAGAVQVQPQPVDCTERIVTPHDPGVRAGQKRGTHWRGEKVHITETAEPGGPNFITDVTTSNASSGDTEALPEIRAHLATLDLLPAEQFVDSGYVSGQQLAQSQAVGIELVGPPRADTSANEFKLADFRIDHAARQAICPHGQVSVKWRRHTERDGSQAVQIQFAAATCAACPLRARCTTSASGRSLHLNEHYPLLVARRAEAQTEAFRLRLHARPAIEATLSELVRRHGLRRHRYRGEAKRHLENLLKATACNLKRLARALAAQLQTTVDPPRPLAVAA
ncbi:MAG: IS1182 family transposase, partial [Streptosporangiaceae bacterium]